MPVVCGVEVNEQTNKSHKVLPGEPGCLVVLAGLPPVTHARCRMVVTASTNSPGRDGETDLLGDGDFVFVGLLDRLLERLLKLPATTLLFLLDGLLLSLVNLFSLMLLMFLWLVEGLQDTS